MESKESSISCLDNPEKGTIKENIFSTCHLGMKPGAYFKEDATFPRIKALPEVGSVIRERILSKVDLPAPL